MEPCSSKEEPKLSNQNAKRLTLAQTLERVRLKDSKFIMSMLTNEYKIKGALTMDEFYSEVYLNYFVSLCKGWPLLNEYKKSIQNTETDELYSGLLKEYVIENMKVLDDMDEYISSKKVSCIQYEPLTKDYKPAINIRCEKTRLYTLFYKYPHPDSLSIFNPGPALTNSKAHLQVKTYQLLSWPNFRCTVKIPFFSYVRKNVSGLKYYLINKKLNIEEKYTDVSLDLFMRSQKSNIFCKKQTIKKFLTNIVHLIFINTSLEDVCQLILKDIENLPDTVEINAEYQHNVMAYPYFRDFEGLIPEIKPHKEEFDHDIYFREIIYPCLNYKVTSFDEAAMDAEGYLKSSTCTLLEKHSNSKEWLTIECVECNVTFTGILARHSALDHLINIHSNEVSKDWTCSQCNITIPLVVVLNNGWVHECDILL